MKGAFQGKCSLSSLFQITLASATVFVRKDNYMLKAERALEWDIWEINHLHCRVWFMEEKVGEGGVEWDTYVP